MRGKLIREGRALSEENFVPQELLHRQDQLKEVRDEILPVIEDSSERHILIHGPPGTGKTTLAKYLKRELETQFSTAFTAFVNCWTRYTRFKVLYSIVEQSGHYRLLHGHLTSTEDLISKINSIKEDKPTVIFLDEIDLLNQPETLYDLTGENTALVMICNDRESFLGLDQRTQSRLSGKKAVKFPRYSHEELVDILTRRRDVALGTDLLSNLKLDRIAEAAKGDARTGIRIMRLAAEKAQDDGAEEITDDHIDYGIDESDQEYRKKNMSKLNKHQRLMIEILEDLEELSPGDLYELYHEHSDDPVSRRTMRRYLNKLERYNLVELKGRKRGRQVVLTE